MYIAISAAGVFVTDDGGKTWRPANRGLVSPFQLPDPDAEVGHCVHHIAMHPSRPGILFMQKHWDVMRSDNAGESWHQVSGNLPTDFGFPIEVHAHEPDTIYVVPIKSDAEHFPLDGKLRVYRSRTGGNEWEPLSRGLPQKDCYVNVLRDAMAADSLEDCGVVTSAPRAGKSMPLPTPGTRGSPSSVTCRPCYRSRCRRWQSLPYGSRGLIAVRLPELVDRRQRQAPHQPYRQVRQRQTPHPHARRPHGRDLIIAGMRGQAVEQREQQRNGQCNDEETRRQHQVVFRNLGWRRTVLLKIAQRHAQIERNP